MIVTGTDFDDTFRLLGSSAVKKALDAAQWPDEEPPMPDLDDGQDSGVNIIASPFEWRAESAIPPRRWVYGKHLLRGFVSLDVAAGGVGKSSVKIGEAIAMATGRDIYEKGLPEGALSVWLYNLEDPHEEIERRIHATCKRFGISPEDFGGRLFVNSGRDNPLVIAEDTPNGARIIRPAVNKIEEQIRANKVDVISVDPFVSSHSLNENDNRAIDMVAKEWSALAGRCNVSVNLVHHVRKETGGEASADSARGASSLIGAARSVVVYNRMTKEEAEAASVPADLARFHFRTTNDKANLAPPEKADWYRMNNVDLENGDQVGVACPWHWPDAFDGVTKYHLMQVQRKISEGDWRADVRAKAWVGSIVAEVCGFDPKTQRARIASILDQWVKAGVIRHVEKRDEKTRQDYVYVEVAEWVSE